VIAVAGRAEHAGTVPRVLGVDVSLSSTGLALADHRGLRTGLVRTRPVEGYAATTTRLQYIKAGVREWQRRQGCDGRCGA
jgi:hypothetical protein